MSGVDERMVNDSQHTFGFGLLSVGNAFLKELDVARRYSTHCSEYASNRIAIYPLEGAIPSPLFEKNTVNNYAKGGKVFYEEMS